MFDQLKQDQTIGFSYTESNGRRMAGFQVWDRPESRLSEVIEQLNAANAIADRAERDKALAAVRAAAPPGPRRVFVGKNGDREALVSLADAQGKPRVVLTVDPVGNSRIDFLDESGKVVTRGEIKSFVHCGNWGQRASRPRRITPRKSPSLRQSAEDMKGFELQGELHPPLRRRPSGLHI